MNTELRYTARVIEDALNCIRRDALTLAAALPADAPIDRCEVTRDADGDPMVILPGWVADDGNAEVYYPLADSGEEAASEYVCDGDWGDDGGSVCVRAWRVAHVLTDDGVIEMSLDSDSYDIDIEPNHARLISGAVGRYGDSCGNDPDDHDWTSEGEGGCDENPGVWSLGGTTLVYASHCRKCGLRRVMTDPGSQRNPGEGVRYEYQSA